MTEMSCDLKQLWRSFCSELTVSSLVAIVLFISCFVGVYFSLILGLMISFSFAIGCAVTVVLLEHKESVSFVILRARDIIGIRQQTKTASNDCTVCGIVKCNRHLTAPNREPWRSMFISKELDDALDSLYTNILNGFVESWFSLLSRNEDFVMALKYNLREATCRLILKVKELNAATILTDQLLPTAFYHHEVVQKMIENNVPENRLVSQFLTNGNIVHPAVRNRKAELDYLRAIAKCLLPRVCNNQNLDCKLFFSLGRELLACWVLLPLMDVLANPHWLNAVIIAATNKSTSNISSNKDPKANEQVMFLAKFGEKINLKIKTKADDDKESPEFLKDQDQLYLFMQFLKREGAVDLLRFYLDVDNLNNELMDPKLTIDPAKLSLLQQQSETLLLAYQGIMKRESKAPVETLAEAQEDVRRALQGKWRRAFHLTPEYFRLVYGNREIREVSDAKSDIQTGPVSKISSKLKVAIRGAIDGSPLEATEVPTVWDALTDEPQASSNSANNTIYSSMAQKLRKERGQNLDAFINTFIQSIEQSSMTDIGEDVIMMKEFKPKPNKPQPPGISSIFGNLFNLRIPTYNDDISHSYIPKNSVIGPTQCLIYLLSKILDAPRIMIRFVLGLIRISQSLTDTLLIEGINKLITIGLYQPRLTLLIKTIEDRLFDTKQDDSTAKDLQERKVLAKNRLMGISKKFGCLADTLQCATLNKHLAYCLLDIILAELYPELNSSAAK